MGVCTAKISIKAEGKDVDVEELKYNNLNIEYSRLEEEVNEYENQVLALTNL